MAVSGEALKSGNIIGALGIKTGSFSAIGTILLWVLISFLILGAVGVGIYWWYQRRVFSQQVMIFGKIGNAVSLKVVDKARYLPVGTSGDRLFVLQKLKKHFPPPTIQTGRNLWFYVEREDGEYINVGMQDLDEVHRKLAVKFVDTDMRMQRLGIEKNLKDRLQQQTFWQKYGQTIMSIIFVIFVMIALVVLFSKLVDVSKALTETASAVNNMATNVAKFYTSRVNGTSPNDIVNGNSGLIPVQAFIPLLFLWRKK